MYSIANITKIVACVLLVSCSDQSNPSMPLSKGIKQNVEVSSVESGVFLINPEEGVCERSSHSEKLNQSNFSESLTRTIQYDNNTNGRNPEVLELRKCESESHQKAPIVIPVIVLNILCGANSFVYLETHIKNDDDLPNSRDILERTTNALEAFLHVYGIIICAAYGGGVGQIVGSLASVANSVLSNLGTEAEVEINIEK